MAADNGHWIFSITPSFRMNTPVTMPDRPRIRLFSGVLLLVWFLTAFVWVWFARDLNIKLGEWPINFWMAAQGSLLLFLLVTVLNVWDNHRLEKDGHEDKEPPSPP